jgi:hypothetical protein
MLLFPQKTSYARTLLLFIRIEINNKRVLFTALTTLICGATFLQKKSPAKKKGNKQKPF